MIEYGCGLFVSAVQWFIGMDNIYYVGRRNDLFLSRQIPTNPPSRREVGSTPTSSGSTSARSCRKVEQKLLHLRQTQGRSASSQERTIRRLNTEQLSQPRKEGYRVVVMRSPKRATEECSGISMQSVQGRVRFNRVQQAPLSRNSHNLLERMQQNSRRSTQRKCEHPLTKMKNMELQGKEVMPTPKDMKTRENQDETSECSQLGRMYRLQPKKRLFLCENCLLFLPFIEIKPHYMQCCPPKAQAQIRAYWDRLCLLLQELHTLHPHNDELFRLSALMEAYPQARKRKQPAPALYSSQLERILRYQAIVDVPELNMADFFWAVENLGDKFQTIRQVPTRWLLCS